MTSKNRNWHYKNGIKGGRPKQDSEIYIKIPNIKTVNLTSKQYDILLKRFGEDKLQKAIFILEDWLNSNIFKKRKAAGKCHYAYFRRDGRIIQEALNCQNN